MNDEEIARIKPLGNRILVKKDPPPTHKGQLELASLALGKKECKDCGGRGGSFYPVFEEDGIRINRHVDVECPKCSGRGWFGGGYDPRFKDQLHTAVVLKTGPGEYRRKIRPADWKTLYWKSVREPMPVSIGDRVVLGKWAGKSNWSWEFDDEYLIVEMFEVLANLGEAGEGLAPQVYQATPGSRVQHTPTEQESS